MGQGMGFGTSILSTPNEGILPLTQNTFPLTTSPQCNRHLGTDAGQTPKAIAIKETKKKRLKT